MGWIGADEHVKCLVARYSNEVEDQPHTASTYSLFFVCCFSFRNLCFDVECL